jgi:radical SAM superfamily enzyme YgiQ (UPF0313 family)
MKITLLACYEQGHQPLSLASPLAVLRMAGFQPEAFDLAVQSFPGERLADSSMVAISTPMHTALKLAVAVAERVRALNPEAHICFYGAYAWLNGRLLLASGTEGEQSIADSAIGGEYEEPLLSLARRLSSGQQVAELPGVMTTVEVPTQAYLRRTKLPLPDRSTLPPVREYAHFVSNGHQVAAGYTESSRGCLHMCRHCPVVPVYGGRFFVVPTETVLGDIRQQAENGARNITFGDPDFLNGPGHALRIARLLYGEFPEITFDFTTKVEHIIQHREIIGELRGLGAAFVLSAFESTSDEVLARLHKGHTLADMDRALEILDSVDLPVQATWVPFTPWTSLDDYLHMLGWIRARRLIQHVAAVQLSIRLLVPPGSALLDHTDRDQWQGALDEKGFSYLWRHDDPRMDQLQQLVARIVEQKSGRSDADAFAVVEELAYGVAGKALPQNLFSAPMAGVTPPRLTEDWFC